MTQPLFSVIVATHHRPALLERCLGSLKRQSFRDFEIVLVSDEPSAATHAVAGGLLDERDVYIRRRGRPGPAASRNVGLRAAAADFVLFLDDDDSFEPDLLRRYADCGKLDASTVLYCDTEEIVESRNVSPPREISSRKVGTGSPDVAKVRVGNFLPNNCIVVPRHAATRYGFDEALEANEDWDFLLGLLEHQRFCHVDFSGARVHRDESGVGHRNTQDIGTAALNHLSLYRKWRGRDAGERAARAEILARWGLAIPADWL